MFSPCLYWFYYEYVLYGVENQRRVHFAMPVRNGLYDMLDYAGQVEEAAKSHKKERKEQKGKVEETEGGKIPSTEEFLSGFWKEDKLVTAWITSTALRSSSLNRFWLFSSIRFSSSLSSEYLMKSRTSRRLDWNFIISSSVICAGARREDTQHGGIPQWILERRQTDPLHHCDHLV